MYPLNALRCIYQETFDSRDIELKADEDVWELRWFFIKTQIQAYIIITDFFIIKDLRYF